MILVTGGTGFIGRALLCGVDFCRACRAESERANPINGIGGEGNEFAFSEKI